jgi:hypothetical protein
LWVYAILRSIPSKGLGVLAIGLVFISLFALPFIGLGGGKFRIMTEWLFWTALADLMLLTWLGGQEMNPTTIFVGQCCTGYLFFYLLVCQPLVGYLEQRMIIVPNFHNNRTIYYSGFSISNYFSAVIGTVLFYCYFWMSRWHSRWVMYISVLFLIGLHKYLLISSQPNWLVFGFGIFVNLAFFLVYWVTLRYYGWDLYLRASVDWVFDLFQSKKSAPRSETNCFTNSDGARRHYPGETAIILAKTAQLAKTAGVGAKAAGAAAKSASAAAKAAAAAAQSAAEVAAAVDATAAKLAQLAANEAASSAVNAFKPVLGEVYQTILEQQKLHVTHMQELSRLKETLAEVQANTQFDPHRSAALGIFSGLGGLAVRAIFGFAAAAFLIENSAEGKDPVNIGKVIYEDVKRKLAGSRSQGSSLGSDDSGMNE